jgi:lipopolysaccharide export system protein LptA
VRWPQAARLVVAVAGLGTAAAVYVYSRDRAPQPTPPPLATAADPAAKLQSGRGSDLRYRGNELESTVDYQSLKQFADGKFGWQHAKLTFMKDGTTLAADLVECTGELQRHDGTGECRFTDHVQFTSTDNTRIEGDRAVYNGATGEVTVPGAVTFAHGRMSGTGTGGVYERQAGTFRLLADAHVIVADDPDARGGTAAGGSSGAAPGGQIDATAHTMTFTKRDRTMVFDQQAHIVRNGDTLTGDRATLLLSEDERTFTGIQLAGNARVMPAPGAATGLPEMGGDTIELGFYPDGQALQHGVIQRNARMVLTDNQGRRSIEAPVITFDTASDGRTLTRLEAPGHVVVRTPASTAAPERTITAASLVATGDDQHGLTGAKFDGGAEFRETIPASPGHAASRRTGTSRTLTMAIKGQFDVIDRADFQQDVRFVDEDVTGDADVGVYLAAAGKLDLLPAPQNARRFPHVKTASVTVDASQKISVDLNTNDLDAQRDVKTLSTGEAKPAAARETALFNSHDPIYGSAQEFHYVAATKRATYKGPAAAPARVRQTDSSIVSALEITIDQEKQDLTATGQVDSTFAMTTDSPAAATAAPTSYRVTANTLVYIDAARTATYVGAPATLTSTDGETTAGRIVLTLAEAQRAIERLDATASPPVASVHSVLQQGREATGVTLVYVAATDLYTLTGAPLTLQTRDADGTCTLATGNLARFTGEVGAPEFPIADNPGNSVTKAKQPCTGPLRK